VNTIQFTRLIELSNKKGYVAAHECRCQSATKGRYFITFTKSYILLSNKYEYI